MVTAMAQNTLSEEYSTLHGTVSANDLFDAVWKISRGDSDNTLFLKNHIIPISILKIPWSGIHHLAILGKSEDTCNNILAKNGYSAGFYISKELHWLLLIHPEEEDCLQTLDCCCSNLKVLEIYNSDLPSLDLSSTKRLERLIVIRCAKLSCISRLEKLSQLNYLTLVDCSKLTELPGIEKLPRLTTLKLTRCLNNTVQNTLANLTQLTTLRLVGYKTLTKIHFTKNGYQLKSLSVIGFNQLSILSGLSNLEQLTSLDVHDCTKLTSLLELSKMENLTTLDVSGCDHLLDLDLSGCRSLSKLKGLDDLSHLTTLNLSGCIELSIPSELNQLKELKTLNLAECNCLSALKLSGHGSLSKLILNGCSGVKELNLSGCKSLTELPGLEDLTQLSILNLSKCTRFSVLPNLSNLRKLRFLDLSDTAISKLPDSIRDLNSLWHLNLSGMHLQELPEFLPDIASRFYAGAEFDLQYELEMKFDELFGRLDDDRTTRANVGLIRTTIEGVDMSIFEQPYEMVVEWFENHVANTTRPLNEIKVVFLGDGEAGKTRTIARLMNDGGDPDHVIFDDQSTPGIVIRNKQYDLDDRKIQVHYWDFGGQEIMHSMHRIFLTGRTMYVILLNARDNTQNDRAKYWLHNVKSFAPDAPILLVLNKIDQNENASVDEPDLRGRYCKLTQVLKLSALKFSQEEFNTCFTNVLLEEIQNTGYLDAQWPTSWTRVKNRLVHMANHYILGDDYQAICKECRVNNNQKILLHWFNDLGVSFCCDGEDDYTLEDYVILRPDWITNALYIILFNALEGAHNGLIPHRSIYNLLKNVHNTPEIRCTLPQARYNAGDIQYVLGIMRKFSLSFTDGHENEFIPMLCQQNSMVDVQYYMKDAEILEFNIEFDYLPNNLLHRLMVERYNELDMTTVWRTGARFQLKELGYSAVVVIDGNILRFFIRHCDPMHRPNTYLTMLKAHVDRIVAKMGVQPPSCQLIYKLEDGRRAEFSYDRLLKLRKRGRKEEYCDELDEDFLIEDILNQSAPDSLEDEQKLLDAIRKSCLNIQAESDYYLKDDESGWGMEDKRNRRIRDDLQMLGYDVKDQTQRGLSRTGKGIGELDLLLYNDRKEPWTIIEALRVSSSKKNEWNKHLNKLLENYNYFGAPCLYLLTYVDSDATNFHRIWKEYQCHIPKINPGKFTYYSNSLSIQNTADSPKYVKTAKCQYDCGGQMINAYHIFVRIPKQGEIVP